MPGIRPSRRTLRDEEAGLLFRWRIPGGSLGRTLTAVVLAMVVFGVVGALFRVSARTARTVNRETAHFVLVPPDSSEGRRLLEWARQNSPFPDRWEVEVDGTLRQHLELFEAELARGAAYEPLLRPLAGPERAFPLPELYDASAPRLPPVPRPVPPAGARRPLESRAVTSASESLEERWGELSWRLEDLLGQIEGDEGPVNPQELLGLQRRFLVTVDRDGKVEFCQSLDEVESVLDGVLAARLRRHKLASTEGGEPLAGGYVEVTVRGEPKREDDTP